MIFCNANKTQQTYTGKKVCAVNILRKFRGIKRTAGIARNDYFGNELQFSIFKRHMSLQFSLPEGLTGGWPLASFLLIDLAGCIAFEMPMTMIFFKIFSLQHLFL